MIYKILPDTDPLLRQVSELVNLTKVRETKAIVDKMRLTLAMHGGLGLAAVQCGILQRILIARPDVRRNKYITIINPAQQSVCETTESKLEGCLSLGRRVYEVNRPTEITLYCFDEHMHEQTKTFTGWTARIIQHELDHLNGILISDVGTLLEESNGSN